MNTFGEYLLQRFHEHRNRMVDKGRVSSFDRLEIIAIEIFVEWLTTKTRWDKFSLIKIAKEGETLQGWFEDDEHNTWHFEDPVELIAYKIKGKVKENQYLVLVPGKKSWVMDQLFWVKKGKPIEVD